MTVAQDTTPTFDICTQNPTKEVNSIWLILHVAFGLALVIFTGPGVMQIIRLRHEAQVRVITNGALDKPDKWYSNRKELGLMLAALSVASVIILGYSGGYLVTVQGHVIMSRYPVSRHRL